MLEVKTEAGIILDKDNETLLAGGALPGEQIIVTLLTPRSSSEPTIQPPPCNMSTSSRNIVPQVKMS
jgi:hypothetical protein